MNGLAILIPCKAFDEGKSRLAPALSADARRALCRHLLRLTLRRALVLAPAARVFVVGDDPAVLDEARRAGARPLAVASRGLNSDLAAANAALLRDGLRDGLLVLPIDLVHAPAAELRAFLAAADDAPLAIAPDHAGDGTNLLLIGPGLREGFAFAYGPGSFGRHCAIAARGGGACVVRRGKIARDIDSPGDYRAWRHPSGGGRERSRKMP